MSRKTIFAAILSLTLMGSIVPSAMAEIFQKSIILGPGAGEFVIEDLGVGDTMVLTLVNPTNRPMVFETTQNLGNDNSWTVPANSSITVDYTYTKAFDDDVEFVVKEVGATQSIATGTLIPVEQQVTTTTTTQQQPMEQPAAYQTGTPVRGYW